MLQYWIYGTIALLGGYILDFIAGDPHWLYHPVRLIGNWITWLRVRLLKDKMSDQAKLFCGGLLVFIVTGSTIFVSGLILLVLYHVHTAAGIVAETIMCYQILAVKSLKVESMKVYDALVRKTLTEARTAVSMIVGRDTDSLDAHGVIRAAVETVAENTSDGVIAPLFYMMLFGPVGGFAYKAVNTMDSMIGYKNEQYLYFGRAAAKLDDAVNWLPARLAAWLMIAAAAAAGALQKAAAKRDRHRGADRHADRQYIYSAENALRIYRRDRKKHASPNAAQTESVCAGALQVALSGDNYYFGRLVHKPQLGDAMRDLEAEDIRRANVLLYVTAFFMMMLVMAVRLGIIFIL